MNTTDKDSNGCYAPGPSARNALKKHANSTWTETQPDSYQLCYDKTGTLTTPIARSAVHWTRFATSTHCSNHVIGR